MVIASFSLTMQDIRAAIQKMLEAASGYIYLYHFAGDTSWDIQHRELWPRLHDREYYAVPGCDVLYNVLYQMGIYPNVVTFRHQDDQRFISLKQALESIKPQYLIQTPEQEAILSEYFGHALKEEDGSLILPATSTRVKVWWKKDRF